MGNDLHLILFFTRGVSLRTWVENGSFQREIALYLRLQKKGVKIAFVTYGNSSDLWYGKNLPGIKILCNKWNLPKNWYQRMLPILFPIDFHQASIIKTNQMNGADIAMRVARFWSKPLLARSGYIWSEFAAYKGHTREMNTAEKIEQDVFAYADRVVVTTPEMLMSIAQTHEDSRNKIVVIPNYVLTDVFTTSDEVPVKGRICFVGRLAEQKNLVALMNACEGLDTELHMVGDGPLRESLVKIADDIGLQVVIHGNVDHHQLPRLIHSSSIFALVSTHEGHPKALLEAMSCGAAVLAADSPGIREQIIHGKTGWLCGTDAPSIRKGILYLLSNPTLRAEMGHNARRFILENYSIDKVVEMEYSLLEGMLRN